MKCEVCLELLEEYLDGELAHQARAQVGAHLVSCPRCASSLNALTVEAELFARYDREVEVPPFLWTRISQYTLAENEAPRRGWSGLVAALLSPAALASAVAVLLLAIVTVGVYWRGSQRNPNSVAVVDPRPAVIATREEQSLGSQTTTPEQLPSQKLPKLRLRRVMKRATPDESGVLSSELAYLDLDERETAKHIEQTENLLRSIRNVPVSDSDEEIDVSYDKALSRRLLNENVVLRRDAEMKAKFPTKTLLADLEPFLIDIANLPDRARPEELRVIKERVQKTEIVAALLDYQDRGRNNR